MPCLLLLGLANTLDKMAFDRLAERRPDHFAADSRMLEIIPRQEMPDFLRIAIFIAPTEGLADEKRHQPNASAGTVRQANVNELVRCIGGVAGRQGKALEISTVGFGVFSVGLVWHGEG